jgi:hypothetical protein
MFLKKFSIYLHRSPPMALTTVPRRSTSMSLISTNAKKEHNSHDVTPSIVTQPTPMPVRSFQGHRGIHPVKVSCQTNFTADEQEAGHGNLVACEGAGQSARNNPDIFPKSLRVDEFGLDPACFSCRSRSTRWWRLMLDLCVRSDSKAMKARQKPRPVKTAEAIPRA